MKKVLLRAAWTSAALSTAFFAIWTDFNLAYEQSSWVPRTAAAAIASGILTVVMLWVIVRSTLPSKRRSVIVAMVCGMLFVAALGVLVRWKLAERHFRHAGEGLYSPYWSQPFYDDELESRTASLRLHRLQLQYAQHWVSADEWDAAAKKLNAFTKKLDEFRTRKKSNAA